jgi:putative membrane protein
MLMGEGLMKVEVAMGGMMGGTMGAWIVLWIFLGLALAIGGGIVAARVLNTRRGTDQRQVQATESAAVQEAKDILRRRYANGEISREDYLQGKVELED